jgi:predicted DNA-binding transcriptional regulator AlpA
MPEVLTQLAEYLQLSEHTIYRLLGRGQLPGFKLGDTGVSGGRWWTTARTRGWPG